MILSGGDLGYGGLRSGGMLSGSRRVRTVLSLPGTAGSYVSCPDAAALRLTGDMDDRFLFRVPAFPPAARFVLGGKFIVGNQGHMVRINADGMIGIYGSADGSNTQLIVVSTTTAPVVPNVYIYLRVTRQRSTGEHRFYVSGDGSAWTQLGAAVTALAGVPLYASTAAMEIGSRNGGTADMMLGKVLRAEFRNGIDGTIVASPDFTAQTPGARSLTDAQGNVWTLNGGAAIVADTP